MDFLRDPTNKEELFSFLTVKIRESNWPPAKTIYVTSGETVETIGAGTRMQNCNHEEADTRIVVHAMHAVEQGAKLLDVADEHFKKLESLTVILYDRTSPLSSINEARRELFCQKNRTMDKLPPTSDALQQHVRRAVYQAGIWTTSRQTQYVVPSPQDFAWTKVSGSWVPVWMTVVGVSRECRELIKCCCKRECSVCKCVKANVECSPLCKCKYIK
ncbi:hypothetical protein Pcinc_006755 [Petrolisthes cinctipes]|uniref:Tesmin/TSO1-like CXC domain-containing protein n=1 Tax=Petrolisthes cinctipes TaxID=88211 RepID=A0AAE1G9S0_PETCI|nr:hypothetical protein Pcinc_006755 [Petrolisthes cinctipes]